jgi:hypothetical protein
VAHGAPRAESLAPGLVGQHIDLETELERLFHVGGDVGVGPEPGRLEGPGRAERDRLELAGLGRYHQHDEADRLLVKLRHILKRRAVSPAAEWPRRRPALAVVVATGRRTAR